MIRGNRIVKIGADGIIVGSSDGALVESNVCYEAGVNAMAQPVVTQQGGGGDGIPTPHR